MGSFSAFDYFFVFSFSVLVLREANKSPTHRILVGNQREKTTFRSWFPFPFFFVHLVTILYCSDIVWSKRPLCTFLLVSLIRNFLSFLFYFLPFFGWEFSFFSFCFLPLFDWEFPFFSFFASEGKD